MTIDTDFVASIRSGPTDDTRLRELLGNAGWLKDLPAIKDEHGVVLVGNRRMKVAAELGIEPVVRVVTFGSGPDADRERASLSWVSNEGAAGLSIADRKRMAERLYRSEGMTQAAIAKVMGVSQTQVSLDLAALLPSNNAARPLDRLGRPRSPGRPRGNRTGAARPPAADAPARATPTPAAPASAPTATPTPPSASGQAEQAQRIVRPLIEAGQRISPTRLEQAHGIPRVHFRNAIAIESARWAASQTAVPDVDTASLPRTAQDRLAAAMRQQERRLNADHAVRMNEVDEEVRRRVVDGNRDYLARLHEREREAEQQIATYREFTNRNRPLLTIDQFNLIRKCLHQAGVAARPQDFDDAFILINAKKFQLTGQR